MFTLAKKNSPKNTAPAQDFRTEKAALLAALFLLAFGLGLVADGKKIYSRQLKLSQRVDYKATLNPYAN